MEGSSNAMRVGYADISMLECTLVFKGKNYATKILQTGLGEFLSTATQVSMLLTGADEVSASDHFYNVSKRCSSLQHNGKRLEDHIQVRSIKIIIRRKRYFMITKLVV